MPARFWIGGTGNWTDTAHWSASSGSTGGATVPGSADTATFDASSGTGTCTVNTTPVTIQSLSFGASTMTVDLTSVATLNITSTTGNLSGTGSGARGLTIGACNIIINSAASTILSFGTSTSLSLPTHTGSITINGSQTGFSTVALGTSLVWNSLTLNGSSGGGSYAISSNTSTLTDFDVLATGGPCRLVFTAATSQAVTNAMNIAGTSTNLVYFGSNTPGTSFTITTSATNTFDWCAFADTTFSGGTNTATNSFNLGKASSVTITPPSVGSSAAAGVIGS